MSRSRDLQNSEKAIIIKETAKNTSCADVVKLLGRHVRTVKRFLENPSSCKQRSDRGKVKPHPNVSQEY